MTVLAFVFVCFCGCVVCFVRVLRVYVVRFFSFCVAVWLVLLFLFCRREEVFC